MVSKKLSKVRKSYKVSSIKRKSSKSKMRGGAKSRKTSRKTSRKASHKARKGSRKASRKASKSRKMKMSGGNPFKTNDAFLGNLNYEQECPDDKAAETRRAMFKKALEDKNHPCNIKLSNVGNPAVINPKTKKPYTVEDLPLELVKPEEKDKMAKCVAAVKSVNDVPCGEHKSMTTCLGKNAGQRPDGSFGRFRGEPVRIKNAHLLGQTVIDLQDYDEKGNTKSYNYCLKYKQQGQEDTLAAEMSDPLKIREGGVALKSIAFDEEAMNRLREKAKLRYYEANKTNKYLVGGAKRRSKRSRKSSRK